MGRLLGFGSELTWVWLSALLLSSRLTVNNQCALFRSDIILSIWKRQGPWPCAGGIPGCDVPGPGARLASWSHPGPDPSVSHEHTACSPLSPSQPGHHCKWLPPVSSSLLSLGSSCLSLGAQQADRECALVSGWCSL